MASIGYEGMAVQHTSINADSCFFEFRAEGGIIILYTHIQSLLQSYTPRTTLLATPVIESALS